MLSGKRILIENCAGLGDTIMFTPTLRELKKQYPTCILSFATKKSNTYLLQNLPYVDNVYCMDGYLKEWNLLPILYKQDYVIFTSNQPRLLRLAPFLQIPHIFSKYKEKYEKKKLAQKWIHSWVLDNPQFAAQTIADTLSNLLEVKIDISYQCDVPIPKLNDLTPEIRSFINSIKYPYILIAPVSSRPERDIPLQFLNNILHYLSIEKNMTCIIIGDANKPSILQNEKIHNLLGKTSLKEAIMLIDKAKAVVCTDSGPMHIAGACKKHTVALFTRDIASRWAPKKYCHPVSIHMHCSPCNDEIAEACPHHDCMNKIPLNMILCSIDDLLNRNL